MTEKEDREFIKVKLPNFKKLGIKTYGYVQGLNVVTDEFRDESFFAVIRGGEFFRIAREDHMFVLITLNLSSLFNNA